MQCKHCNKPLDDHSYSQDFCSADCEVMYNELKRLTMEGKI